MGETYRYAAKRLYYQLGLQIRCLNGLIQSTE